MRAVGGGSTVTTQPEPLVPPSRRGGLPPDRIDAVAKARRVLVLGPSGSGKTRLAMRLAQVLGHPTVHLDAHFWHPGWVPTPQPEWRRVVETLVAGERWIMDGTYEASLDLRVPAADAIVVLERSRLACLWNVVRRSVTCGDGPRPDAPPGQPIDLPFLRYIWGYPSRTRPLVASLLRQHGPGTPVLTLAGPADVAALLAELAGRCSGSSS